MPSSRILSSKESASLSGIASAAFLEASYSGNLRIASITKAVRLRKTIRIPGMIPLPDKTRNAPIKNVPSCAVTLANLLTTVTSYRLLRFAFSTATLLLVNNPNTAFFALKHLMTEKSLKLSFNEAINSLFFSEMVRQLGIVAHAF